MPRASVSDYTQDLTNRVSTTSTYAAAIVVASKKGPADTPVLVGGQTKYLQKFTPNETLELGWDAALYEAWIYLAQQNNLYVVRALAKDALYGGCKIRTFKSELDNKPLEKGFDNIDTADFDYENDALLIYGADQGDYNNDLSVAIITDPDEVKLEGCFIVRVYKKGVKVEDHICSLDPSFKNGFGTNCYAENVLKTSLYVRCDVNDDDDAITDNAYAVKVAGTVQFTNETIKITANMLRDHAYKLGDIVRLADLENQTAFYECTQAGTTAHVTPGFTKDDAYLAQVVDGDCTWKLKEVVKKYFVETQYNAGDIITIAKGTKVMNFRARTSGTTSTIEPAWLDGETPAITVQDGTVTWVNQDQAEEVSVQDAYTFKQGVKDSKLDLSKYSVYSDYFMASKLALPETVQVQDPTLTEPEIVEKAVKYTAVYTGNASEKHYTLPKASKKVNGAYVPTALAGGFDGTAVTDADRIRALNTLKSTKDYTFQLIMDGGNTTPAYHRAIETLCEARKQSCHGIISVPFENGMGMITGDPQVDTVDYRKNTLGLSSTNLELYTTHQLVYDQFNDRNMYVSPSGFVAAQIMNIAQDYGWHWAVAGENRGIINSLDTAATYDDATIDTFCDNQINPIIKEPNIGQMIGDDYTLMSKACALQDAHTSRYLNIYLRPRIRQALNSYLFEFNDDETRKLIVKMLETFMQPQLASRAIQSYRIVCDTTNNSPSDIQNSICNVWIYIQPMYIIRWLRVGYILTNQGAEDAGVSEA